MDIYGDAEDRETNFDAKSVMIPHKEFIAEHKKLVKELREGNPKVLRKEARAQQKELRKVERRRKAQEAGKTIAKELGGFAIGAGTTALATPYIGPVAAGALGGALRHGFQKLVE